MPFHLGNQSLGTTASVWRAVSEMHGKIPGFRSSHPDLAMLSAYDDEEPPSGYEEAVAGQAKDVLSKHAAALSTEAIELLRKLSDPEGEHAQGTVGPYED
jgi:hypothetical protein